MKNIPDKITLIGFMGSGKSTVGELLASKLNRKFIDTDDRVIEKSGKSSVAEIFAELGEAEFRNLEKLVTIDITESQEPCIIASGGGLIINPDCSALLSKSTYIIFLETGFTTIESRIHKQISEKKLIRPLFADISKAKALFEERLPIYRENAKLTLITDDLLPQDLADKIIRNFDTNGR